MPYRDLAAIRLRQEFLERELNAVREKRALAATLPREEAHLRSQLNQVDGALRSMSDASDGPLNHVRVASPCTADWNAMKGDDRKRFCGLCKRNVYNLSAMPREEAERFLHTSEGETCVRLARRSDGTVVTNDCPIGEQKRRVRLRVIGIGLGAVVAGGLAVVTAGMTMMGAMERPRQKALPGASTIQISE